MAATVWMPMTRMEPKSWLLGNGEVVTEPALEMTGTGRKVRVAGTTTSVFAHELDTLLSRAVKAVAQDKGTHIWLDLTGGVREQIRNDSFDTAAARAKLHLVHDPTNANAATDLWWRFKDVNTPFEVLLWVRMTNYRHSGVVNGQSISTRLMFPSRTYFGDVATPAVYGIADNKFSTAISQLGYINNDLVVQWNQYLRDNPADWAGSAENHLGAFNHQHARAGVTALLKIVRDFEDLDEIRVPDLGDPYSPSYRALKLDDTNVNAELLSDLTEYLDGAPTIEQAAELYQQMLETLRSVGITVQGKSPNDFLSALLAGEKATLNMQVFNLAEEAQRVDHDHKLSVHLPTGAFIVECSHNNGDKNVVAEKWDEARTMASLTGEEDTLLAYARGYAAEHNARRTKEILKERRAR